MNKFVKFSLLLFLGVFCFYYLTWNHGITRQICASIRVSYEYRNGNYYIEREPFESHLFKILTMFPLYILSCIMFPPSIMIGLILFIHITESLVPSFILFFSIIQFIGERGASVR